MERLVHLLNEVDMSDISPRQFLNDTDHSAVPLIRSLLEQIVITPNGQLDWDKKDELESYGYRLVPVEQDRWGWIQGAVVTDNGLITFG